MCGFAGLANLDGAPADASVVAAMTHLVAQPGPDYRGEHTFSLRGRGVDCAVGFHRLKILDLSDRGHQPMASPSSDVILALNGEIYNAFDYQAELDAAGVSLRSRSDAEIVLHLYERYGLEGFLDRLNGMLAMMIADLRRHQIHLVRDHFGIKPLSWTRVGASILFASEARAFLAHPGFTAAIAERHLDEQLAFRYVAGGASLLKGVHLLRPGHRLRITPDGVTTTRYASIPDATDAGLTPEAAVRATQFQPDAKLARLRPGANLAAAIERRLDIFSEGGGDHLSNWLNYEMQTFLVDVLMRQDKMLMAHGTENRVPFLDRRIVAFARTLKASHLIGDAGKAIVKALARQVFPPAFVDRAKGAFNLPLSQYFRGRRFGELMEEAWLPGMKRRGLVSETAVRALWRRSLSAPALTEVLWIPVALEVWAQQFVDGRRA